MTGNLHNMHLVFRCILYDCVDVAAFLTHLWFSPAAPVSCQVVLVSATLPHEILEMTNKFMTDPVRILVKRDELTLEVTSTSDPTPNLPSLTHLVPTGE